MLRLLVINLLLSLLWPTLNDDFNFGNLLLGFALGFALLSIIDPRYGRFGLRLVSFLLFVLYQILESNVRLAWLVVRVVFNQNTPFHPGIVGVPLTIENDLDKTVLASIITLTPGTLSVDLGRNDDGQELLYVHAVDIGDPLVFRNEIKEKFERRMLQIREDLEEN